MHKAKRAKMDVNSIAKKVKSLKNAEKRRERSMVAARCRRGRECNLFSDLSATLPMVEETKSTLDKASILRLTLCDLHLRKMMNSDGGFCASPAIESAEKFPNFMRADIETQIDLTLGGFILVLREDGDVVYASKGITSQLGIQQHEIMGQSIFDYSHQYDHTDIRSLLKVSHATGSDEETKSVLFRMKCTAASMGRNVSSRAENFKEINCTGHMIEEDGTKSSNKWFISTCQPLPHPSHTDIPLEKDTFVTKHTLDMKFSYVDDAVLELLGYTPEEMVGRSLFEFNHALDGTQIGKAFKSLYDKEQNQTDRYRFLTKGGGWVWVVTQATVIRSSSSKGRPSSVVCIHSITSGREEQDQILSEVQIGDVIKTENNATNQLKPILTSEDEEDNFISDLLVGPLLNKGICSTAKIFTARTKDMDTGYLMEVDDTLIPTLEEPEDLTHLAPMAGDECVSLEIPLLDDLLASLDADDMSYSFLDDEEELQQFDIVQPKATEPEQVKLLGQPSPALSTQPILCSTNPPVPTQTQVIGDYLEREVFSQQVPEVVAASAMGNLVESTPTKLRRLDDGGPPAKVFVLVPARPTAGSIPSTPPIPKNQDDNGLLDLVKLVHAQQLQIEQQALIQKQLIARMETMTKAVGSQAPRRGEKRNFAGLLLNEGQLSTDQLIPQNSETASSFEDFLNTLELDNPAIC